MQKFIASIIYFLAKQTLSRANMRIVVIAGTSGKMAVRDCIANSLRSAGVIVDNRNVMCTNELDIVLSALGIPRFSVLNPADWFGIIRARPVPHRYVCVELGGDLAADITWFIRRFIPFAVFITDIDKFSPELSELIQTMHEAGFVFYNPNDSGSTELMRRSIVRAHVVQTGESRKEIARSFISRVLPERLKNVRRPTSCINC